MHVYTFYAPSGERLDTSVFIVDATNVNVVLISHKCDRLTSQTVCIVFISKALNIVEC